MSKWPLRSELPPLPKLLPKQSALVGPIVVGWDLTLLNSNLVENKMALKSDFIQTLSKDGHIFIRKEDVVSIQPLAGGSEIFVRDRDQGIQLAESPDATFAKLVAS
jgi:hypothetical protein